MARRDDGLLDLLVEAPWWVSIIFLVVTFVAMRVVIPAMLASSAIGAPLGQLIAQFSWVSLVFLLPAGFSVYRSSLRSQRLERQTSIESIRALPWKQFEDLLGEAYRRQGYSVIENASLGADGGVDLTIRRDGATYLVQCKQWRTYKVGVKVIREMFGLMTAHHATGAIVVCSGSFTREAEDFAVGKPIELVDGDRLVGLIASVQTRPMATATRPTATIPSPTATKRSCPKCGGELVLRTAKRGPNAGGQFWGCSNYPKCRQTVPIGGKPTTP
jgi:restriction system protein